MISDKSVGNEVYADFSGFESMRKAARENSPEAVHAVAKQFEGLFLNMMLSSMREANQLFSEDSLLSSKDVRFYEQMLDQQLSVTLTEGKGIGLADEISRQIAQINSRRYDPENNKAPDLQNSNVVNHQPAMGVANYQSNPVPLYNAIPANNPQTESQRIESDKALSEVNAISDKTFSPISPQDFVEKIAPYAQQSAAALGVPVESIIAQAALETGWGRYIMKQADGSSALNFFGIKADTKWQGDKVSVGTLEYRNGVAAKETASFRSYASISEAFSDYNQFLLNKPRYQQALQTVREQNDAKSWGSLLQEAGYATDPNYGKKIASIVTRLQKDGAFQNRISSASK